jgi:PHD/YefM family antitoxin component YafN of YafNO toxin-antitoxin module
MSDPEGPLMSSETPYLLPDGQTAWVIATEEASKHLHDLLRLYREGQTEPLIFGDAGQPEAVVIPWEVWRALVAQSTDEEGFDASYSVLRHRLANPTGPSIPYEDVAAELGIDLDEDIDDSDLKPR